MTFLGTTYSCDFCDLTVKSNDKSLIQLRIKTKEETYPKDYHFCSWGHMQDWATVTLWKEEAE